MQNHMNSNSHFEHEGRKPTTADIAKPQMRPQDTQSFGDGPNDPVPDGRAPDPQVQAQQTLARERHAEACGALDDLRRSVTALTGYPVRIQLEPLSEQFDGCVEIAPLMRQDCHLIRCSTALPPFVRPHAIGHELVHIRLEFEASAAGRARSFFQTPRTRKNFASLYAEHKNLLRCFGLVKPDVFDQAAARDASMLLTILFSRAVDMAVEAWIHRHLPCLSAAQFLAFHYFQATVPTPAQVLAEPTLLRPRGLDIVSLALNGVQALMQDSFFPGASDFAAPYRHTAVFPLASQLWQHWLSVCPALGPGDEYDLADAFGKIVGLSQAYESRTYSRQRPAAGDGHGETR